MTYEYLVYYDVRRSRICVKSSTTDGSLFQPILLSILDCVRDCYASCKGKVTLPCYGMFCDFIISFNIDAWLKSIRCQQCGWN